MLENNSKQQEKSENGKKRCKDLIEKRAKNAIIARPEILRRTTREVVRRATRKDQNVDSKPKAEERKTEK